ncbi:MAG: bifunctional precorrin-2 dehydrogenase/sirohydrochlorin ferrochelatase [Thermoplasmatales archaeon]
MIVDIKLEEKTILFVGEGHEFNQKMEQFRKASRLMLIISPENLENIAAAHENVIYLGKDYSILLSVLERYKPLFIFISTDNSDIDRKLSDIARSKSVMVYVPDRNPLSDVNLCALLNYGPISIAVSTSGKSPAMTVITKKKLSYAIKKLDIINQEVEGIVDLLSSLRVAVMQKIDSKELRKKIMYRLAVDPDIRASLKSADKGYGKALKIIEDFEAGEKCTLQ